jgi:predicted deacylase
MNDSKLDWIEVATMATGLDLRVALHTIEGKADGPTVGITAGIHGDELIPIEVVRHVLNDIDASQLRGRIVAVPLANPLAFETYTRHTPTDMHNLNRVFPGDKDTWMSDLLARTLTERLVPEIDVLLDLHSGGAVPTVDYVYSLNDRELSRSFLFPTMYQGSSYPGSLGTHFTEATGKPVVVAEIGGGGRYDREYLKRGVEGVMNALRKLGVLPGEVTPAPQQILLKQMEIVRPRHGGILEGAFGADRLGTAVHKGTLLGRTVNPQTFETLEEYRAPFDQTQLVLLREGYTKVHPGDYGFMLGNLETAEILSAKS